MKLNNINKIFLVGDLHLGIRNNSVEWADIQKDFLLEVLPKTAQDNGFNPDTDILILEGDIFHSRESINVRIQNDSMEIFEKLSKIFKRGIFIILGNHDVYYKDRNVVHSLKSISHIADNIHVFENPEIITINGSHNFLMLPWVEDTARLNQIITDHKDLCEYIVCHADIKGLRFNKWTKVEHGIEVDMLTSYKRVYAGHIHHRQEFKNVLYTGTPYQMDRGDRGNTKGFYQLDVTTPTLTEEFIENTHSPVYKKFDIFELLEMPADEVIEKLNNSFVDIMISVNFVNKFSVTRFLELISKSTHRKVEFFTYVDQVSDESSTAVDFDPEDQFNVIDIFKSFLRTKDYSQTFKTELAQKFIEIHNLVKQQATDE
jgi:DNA repair exonuclease SbcCD nuclease subunit